ncbi:MAG: ACT domain-containing protein [Clostridia bacterium]|nr:ACT domain-containing protein [Clostridia bacterium]
MEHEALTLTVLAPAFTVCKVRDYSETDLTAEFTFTGRTDRELSLVCPTERTPRNTTAREDGWRGFRIEGQLDFGLTGILAGISAVLAAEKIGIFAVSTFDTDYVLVKAENLARATQALKAAGYAVEG